MADCWSIYGCPHHCIITWRAEPYCLVLESLIALFIYVHPILFSSLVTLKTTTMGFQIKDKEGNAIVLNTLDAEAATFWEQPVDATSYASPKDMWGNWFDMIGYKIHSPIGPRYTSGWANVKHNMFLVSVGGFYKHLFNEAELTEKMAAVAKYLAPYYQLMDHWEAKGYTPHQCQD